MPRIFGCLAIGNLIVLAGTAALGILPIFATPDRHITLALFALLLSCLIQVIILTYFTVTGKMIGQAANLGNLDPAPIAEARRLKRSATHLLGVLVATIVVVTTTGAQFRQTGAGSALHFGAACLLMLVQVFVFYRQYGLIVENGAILDRTLLAYRKRRQEMAAKRTAAYNSTIDARTAHEA